MHPSHLFMVRVSADTQGFGQLRRSEFGIGTWVITDDVSLALTRN
jgi:hypothetical protein